MILTLKLALLLVLVAWVFRQVRKPTGWLGKVMLSAMAGGHAAMTEWRLEQVTIAPNATILDIGCGAGFAVRKLATMARDGKVVGLDFSSTSVAVARDTNAQLIEAGRVNIEQGSVAALPFPDCTFDVVTAMETHYYWPDLPANVREVWRVLKPGGSFVLIAETYRGGPFRFLYALVMPLLRAAYLSDEEHQSLLREAGFVEVETRHVRGKNWILATGQRPS